MLHQKCSFCPATPTVFFTFMLVTKNHVALELPIFSIFGMSCGVTQNVKLWCKFVPGDPPLILVKERRSKTAAATGWCLMPLLRNIKLAAGRAVPQSYVPFSVDDATRLPRTCNMPPAGSFRSQPQGALVTSVTCVGATAHRVVRPVCYTSDLGLLHVF